MKTLKYLSFIAIAFLMLVGGLVTTLNFMDLNKHRDILEKQFTALIGREVSIKGESELSVSLHPRILLRDVRIKNAPWGSQPDMLSIGKAELAVDLLPLFFNKIEVRSLSVDKVDALVESNKEGRSNWALGTPKAKDEKETTSQKSGLQTEIVLNAVLLENCRLSYKEYEKKAVHLTLDKLAVKHINNSLQQWILAAKYNEILINIDGTTSYIHDLLGGRPFQSDLKGKLGNLDFDLKGSLTLGKTPKPIGLNLDFSMQAPDLTDIAKISTTKLPEIGPIKLSGKVSDSDGFYLVKLDSEVDKINLSSDGRISQALDGKGDEVNLSLQAPDLAQIGQLGGTELPKVGPVEIKAKLSKTKDEYKISGLTAKIAKSDIKGEVSIVPQNKPMFIQAKLSSKLLDLTPFQELDSTGKEPPKETVASTKERVFPDTPLPIDQLKMLNADINYTIEKLESSSETLREIKLALKLEDSRLTLDPAEAQLEGGPIGGDFVFDASKQNVKPVLSFNLHSPGLELGKFKVLEETMSGGNTKVTVHLEGSGDSVREIMAGLNGETVLDIGEADMANGAMNLIGGDILSSLLGALAPVEDNAPRAVLECAVVRFDINDGLVLADESLALKTKKTVMVGSGEIDLKTEAISLQLSSHSQAPIGVDAGDLTRAVGLGGTLTHPQPVLDLLGTTKTGATIGAAVLTLGTSYLAQKLVESVISDRNPCQTALNKPLRTSEKATNTPN